MEGTSRIVHHLMLSCSRGQPSESIVRQDVQKFIKKASTHFNRNEKFAMGDLQSTVSSMNKIVCELYKYLFCVHKGIQN